MTPPVFLEGEGALLDDGTFIPAAAIARAVDLISACCEAIAALPADVRAALEAEVRGGKP